MPRRSEPKKTPDLASSQAPALRVGLCQVATRPWDLVGNLERTAAALEEAAARGAALAVTPECVLHGYAERRDGFEARMAEAAEPLDGPSVTRLRDAASGLGLALALGFAEAGKGGRYHNSLALFDAGGQLLQHYRKVHCRNFEDAAFGGPFSPGDAFYVSELLRDGSAFRIGGMICFDREVPETLRCLRSLGAELVVCPLACDTSDLANPRDFVDNEVITRVRATENELFIVVVNHAGRFNGGSYAVGPGGEVIHQMDEKAGVAVLDLPVGIVPERFHSEPLGWMGWGYRRSAVYRAYLDAGEARRRC
jgi:(R)-amidase